MCFGVWMANNIRFKVAKERTLFKLGKLVAEDKYRVCHWLAKTGKRSPAIKLSSSGCESYNTLLNLNDAWMLFLFASFYMSLLFIK